MVKLLFCYLGIVIKVFLFQQFNQYTSLLLEQICYFAVRGNFV